MVAIDDPSHAIWLQIEDIRIRPCHSARQHICIEHRRRKGPSLPSDQTGIAHGKDAPGVIDFLLHKNISRVPETGSPYYFNRVSPSRTSGEYVWLIRWKNRVFSITIKKGNLSPANVVGHDNHAIIQACGQIADRAGDPRRELFVDRAWPLAVARNGN